MAPALLSLAKRLDSPLLPGGWAAKFLGAEKSWLHSGQEQAKIFRLAFPTTPEVTIRTGRTQKAIQCPVVMRHFYPAGVISSAIMIITE